MLSDLDLSADTPKHTHFAGDQKQQSSSHTTIMTRKFLEELNE
jgi:hypothetical protein